MLKNIFFIFGIKLVFVGLMSREGELMRREGFGGGYGSMLGNVFM